MDQNNLSSEIDSNFTINKILDEFRRNNEQTNLQSTLLTIIKDLIVNQGYTTRKFNSKNPFNKFGKKCFSQTDEDGITYEIIKRLKLKKGNYAEFGVGNGLENNTLLLSALGWKGFWLGGEDLVIKYENNNRFRYTKDWITRDNILKLSNNSMKILQIKSLDVVSLDLDGNDYHLCEKLLKNNFQPKLFIVEYNAKFFPPIEFVMEYNEFHNWKLDDNYGASIKSFCDLFNKYNYKLICCNSHTGSNAFFIRKEFEELFADVPEDINKIFMEPNYDLACKYGHFSSSEVIENIMNRNL